MEELEQSLLVKTAGWYYTSLEYRNLSARVCSLYYFLLEGVLTGIWSISLSYIQDNLNLSDSSLGIAVLFSALGTAVTAPITAFLMRTFGIQYVALFAGIAYSGFLPLLGVAKTIVTLSVTMFVYGLAWGMTDISANSSAVLTEIVAGKALLGSFHGSYSLAAAAGSLIGGIMTTNGVGIMTMFLIFFAICGTLSVVFSAALYDFGQEQVITDYNSKMVAEYGTPEETTPHHIRKARGMSDSATQEAVNEIVQGYDAAELGDVTASSSHNPDPTTSIGTSTLPPRDMTYTTDWKNDSNLWLHNDETEASAANPERSLLSPLLDSTEMSSSTRPYNPTAERNRLLSEEIGTYDVRTSQLSIVTLVEPVNPNLLFNLCCLSFLAAFGEGSLVTWMVIYFDRVLGADSVDKSAGFICFMVAMAVGRFCCDYLRRVYGRKLMVFVSGVLAVSGLMLVFAVSTLPSAVAIALSSIGLTITGFGLSTLLPISFSSAGHLTELLHSGTSVATVAVCAYCGSITASPLVGVLSDLTGSLRYGFLFVAVVLSLIVPLSAWIPLETSRLLTRTTL